MNLLLDTQLLLWAAGEPARLTPKAARLIEADDSILHFSVASLWEIVIKASLGRDDFQVDPHSLRRNLLENGFREVEIGAAHVLKVGGLPPLHKDPFDRLLVAQSVKEGVTLVTTDALVARYSPLIIEV